MTYESFKGFTPYQPQVGEEYMNERQQEHFRSLLLAWKGSVTEVLVQ